MHGRVSWSYTHSLHKQGCLLSAQRARCGRAKHRVQSSQHATHFFRSIVELVVGQNGVGKARLIADGRGRLRRPLELALQVTGHAGVTRRQTGR